ncbi:hypothetical protein [Paenibacillus arenosi]|uniref:Uncharacterized protein n=1 Tax=Paenibacillus arenosi TaxID=2774142 RepID=A0ABR9B0Y4_9BACL|nr:hypothetical protein [Paenibacillus arenosi]MBD8500057.1 hypothetical protein [Paenibacillus arenosi]
MKHNLRQDHMRFLKTPTVADLPLGEYFPHRFSINRLGSIATIEPDPKTGAVLFFMSTTCKDCNFEAIEAYCERFQYKTYLFVDGEQSFIDELREKYTPFFIERADISTLHAEINIEVVPWVYALNSVGQIVSGGIFNCIDRLCVKIDPLIKVFDTGAIANDVNQSVF